jgi:hypothetical protein
MVQGHSIGHQKRRVAPTLSIEYGRFWGSPCESGVRAPTLHNVEDFDILRSADGRRFTCEAARFDQFFL